MKILLIIQQPDDDIDIKFALIPHYLLEDEEKKLDWLDAINGKEIQSESCSDIIGKEIRYLFDRLGLDPFVTDDDISNHKIIEFKSKKDLSAYLNPSFPMTIDKITVISWSV